MLSRTLMTVLLSTGAIALAACGDDESETTSSAAAPAASTAQSAGAMDCPDVPVPGHLAEKVKVTGLSCEDTVAIANAAEGNGRAAYESNGFMCEPSDAPDGDTNYRCTMGDATLTFLYGAA